MQDLLTVINGYSELLLSKFDDPADSSRYELEQIWKAGQRAAALTRQLLAFSRKQMLQPEVLNPARMLADCTAMLGRLVGSNVIVETSVPDDVYSIRIDRIEFEQIVLNLVANAIKYNRSGGRVHVAVWPEGSNACLRVRDTGTGISAEDLPRVFDRFYRADKARTAHSGGAGLGLAIAKWIVEAHGGRIACQSTLGQGTEVLVHLPRGEGNI